MKSIMRHTAGKNLDEEKLPPILRQLWVPEPQRQGENPATSASRSPNLQTVRVRTEQAEVLLTEGCDNVNPQEELHATAGECLLEQCLI